MNRYVFASGTPANWHQAGFGLRGTMKALPPCAALLPAWRELVEVSYD